MFFFYTVLYISEGKFTIYSCCGTGKQNIFCSPGLTDFYRFLGVSFSLRALSLPPPGEGLVDPWPGISVILLVLVPFLVVKVCVCK